MTQLRYTYKGYTILKLAPGQYEIIAGPGIQGLRPFTYRYLYDAKWAISKMAEERGQAAKTAWREEFLSHSKTWQKDFFWAFEANCGAKVEPK